MRTLTLRRVGTVVASAAGLWVVREFLFSAQTSDWDGAPLQGLFLVSGWCSVGLLAFALVLGLRGASNAADAIWSGAMASARIVPVWAVALAVASFGGAAALATLANPPRSPSTEDDRSLFLMALAFIAVAGGLLILCASTVLVLAGREFKALVRREPGTRRFAVLAMLAPWILGACAELGFRLAERTVVERYVDGPTVTNVARLARWRTLAWPHAWPDLWEATDHDASPTAPPPDDRQRRARAAFEALTGFDFFSTSRAGD
ncbi:MAG TPA: hypothetical protein VMT18_13835 [Planctomycetota bacterium]|nr:hypothetical protein [Planctomycetota bacterium]